MSCNLSTCGHVMAKLVGKDTRQLHCLCKTVKQLLFDQSHCEIMLCSIKYIFIKCVLILTFIYLIGMFGKLSLCNNMYTLLFEGSLM